MPSLSDTQPGEMSRRSSRLVNRTVVPDDDTASTSSTGSTGQISYRESPFRVFKRKPGNRRAGSASRSAAQESNLSDVIKAESLTVRRSPGSQTLSSTLKKTLMEPSGFSSGYSSSEEGTCTDCRTNGQPTSSAKSPSAGRLGLRDMLTTSPARALNILYFWLGVAWYSLTSGTSLLNVSLLSRLTKPIKKTIVIILVLLLLVFGLWYWFPSLVALLARRSTTSPVQMKHSPVLTSTGDHRDLYSSFSDLKGEIYNHVQERDRKLVEDQRRQMEDVLSSFRGDIASLKQDREKQTSLFETLKKDIKDLRTNMRNVDSEKQALMKGLSEVHGQTSDLRSDVAQLRLVSEQFDQRLGAQGSENAKLKAELTEQLLQHLAGPLDSQSDVVMRPDLQRELEDLEKKILDRLGREEEKKDVWRSVAETLTQEGVGAITLKDVERIVWRTMSLHRAGGIGMADFALESSGASVINTRCSETFHTKSACISLFGFPLWYPSESPRTVIQPELYPGKCWPFRGSQGFLVISLSHPVHITHISLEHLPQVLSPTGNIDSAPKDFAVYGLISETDKEGNHLGTFHYDQAGDSIQTFQLPNAPSEVYQLVELRILSNWGHPEYTCVYRFRVHGRPHTT